MNIQTTVSLAFTGSWLTFWLMLFGAFLIGYFSCFFLGKLPRKDSKTSQKIQEEDEEAPFSGKSYHKHYMAAPPTNDVKAIQTRGRSGLAVDKLETGNKEILSASTQTNTPFSHLGNSTLEEKDDLKKINGIGKFIEEKLNDIGIYTYAQLSKMNEKDMENITVLIEFFPGRIKKDNWKGQATTLLNDKY
ncbi:hypothetical protein ACG2LH_11800 [Zhouia sp. PK063]|uniref:hypothetical protein n=1 Tax=Zhouia sp. PK063 TaxID=3373602 RepID=UPI0037AB6F4F